MSSPFPFRTGYVLDNVCHSGSLPNDGVTDSVFLLDIKHVPFLGSLACFRFFPNAFVRDHVWASICHCW